MSALPPKADVGNARPQVRLGPIGDIVRAFQTRRSGCSFIHELPTGVAENPVFSAAALMPSAGIASLINRRLFMALSALTPGCARAFGRWEQRERRRKATDTAIGGTSAARPGLPGVIIAATIGNVLEWFDFIVYGFFAVTIAEVFFPASNSTVSLLITFGTFGLAYVVRPLGAVIVGTYTDRAGRKAGLTLSIGLMLIGTTLMVITPGYATIGIAAPVIITMARVLQGFSVGGEFGSAVAFLVEHGGERRGYSASWQWATTGIVSVIVSLFGLALTTLLTHEQLVGWGWRVPYVFGLLVGPAGLYIRARVAETPEFLSAEKPRRMPISELLRRQPVSVLLALGAAVISNSSYYLLLYIPTYGVKTLHLPAYTTFAATLIGGIILAVFSVIAGHYSDRTKPRTQLMLINGLAVFARRLSVILADGRLSLARHRDIRRRFPQPDQGGLQRRLAVGAVGAVSSRDARRRSVVQLQRIGNDLRRIRPVYGNVADRADR